MRSLARVAQDVMQDVRSRREPELQLQATKEDLWDVVMQFEETLTSPDVPRAYLREFFARLKQKIEIRELTVAAVASTNRELHDLASSTADTLAFVMEELTNERMKNANLQNRLQDANAQAAVEFDSGMNEVVWIWAGLLASQEGIEIADAYAEIIREIERIRAEQEDDAA